MKPKFISLERFATFITWLKDALLGKVDKEDGKGLSANDFTDQDKSKLDNIESGAQVNLIESISINGDVQNINQKNVDVIVPLVDDTLTHSGQSADAKATGDAITDVSADLTQAQTDIRNELNQAKQSLQSDIQDVSNSIPTDVSQLNNDNDYTTKSYVDDELAKKQDTLPFGTPTTEDVGKALMPKTVENGVVTAWEFGEAGLVDDVQINGTSIVQDKVANIPIATKDNLGVISVDTTKGLSMTNLGNLSIVPAPSNYIKVGEQQYNPIAPKRQHEAVFYGLAKAAGHDEKNSSLPVGQYTDSAKSAIQSMLGIDTAIADAVGDITSFEFQVVDELPATGTKGIIYLIPHPHDDNDGYDEYIWIDDGFEKLGHTDIDLSNYATINYVDSALDNKIDDVQIDGTSIVTNGVAEIPIANINTFGVQKVNGVYGIASSVNGTTLSINRSTPDNVKKGKETYKPIVPSNQHEAVFYGLTKAAGVDMADSANEIGQYTNDAKSAIKSMLGFATSSDISAAIDNLVSTRYYICQDNEYDPSTHIPTLDGELGIIYLVPKYTEQSIIGFATIGTAIVVQEDDNAYYEYIFTGSKFEKIGDTKIDLSDYLMDSDIATDDSVNTMLNQVFA